MSCHPRVTEWTMTIQAHMPHLSKPQATVLALWSLGMVLARSCALTAVSAFLATWLQRKSRLCASSCVSFAMRPRPNVGPLAAPSPWSPALCRSWPGLSTNGKGPNWPWPLMRRPWAPALRSWHSAWSIGAVPSQWPGRYCPPRSSMPGAVSGCACCGKCTGPSHGRGPSLCWPIAACTPAGCFGVSRGWGGTRFCGSIPAGPFGPRATCVACP